VVTNVSLAVMVVCIRSSSFSASSNRKGEQRFLPRLKVMGNRAARLMKQVRLCLLAVSLLREAAGNVYGLLSSRRNKKSLSLPFSADSSRNLHHFSPGIP
jgi:hypothetical protein